MKIKTAMSQLNSFLLAVGLVSVFGIGCSGSQQENVDKLETTTEAKEEAPKAEVEEAVEETAAEPAVAPVTEVAPTTSTTTSAPTGSVDKNRVVRYVIADEGVIRSQPNDTAEQVGKLQKGDMILVIEENGWCKISDTLFIKADSVSPKAVARKRAPAAWTKPAH
jgi:hypothetical protein